MSALAVTLELHATSREIGAFFTGFFTCAALIFLIAVISQ